MAKNLSKTKAVAKIKEQEIERPEESNPWVDYGRVAGGQSNIIGSLLRFNKGDYVSGQDAEEVPIGTKLVVNMDQLLVGWTRWEDNKPAEQIMGLVGDRFQPPRRDALGHDDEDRWETDDKGNARDPWQPGNQVLMKGTGKNKDDLYTYVATSKGGIGAIGRLSHEYGKIMRERPDEYPVIELGVGSYIHKQYGKTKVPVFKIVGWAPKSVFADLEEEEKEQEEATPAKKRKRSAA